MGMARLFERAEAGDREAGIELDIAAYMMTVDVALAYQWSYGSQGRGREIFRHVARLALARHLDPQHWDACRSCKPGAQRAICSACRGTGSLLIPKAEFCALVAPLGHPAGTWNTRIEFMARAIGNWKYGGRVAA